MGFLLRWGGIFLGALSIFSLMQKLGTFRVAPVFGDVLNFYRTSLYPVEETLMAGLRWLFAHFSLALPIVSTRYCDLVYTMQFRNRNI